MVSSELNESLVRVQPGGAGENAIVVVKLTGDWRKQSWEPQLRRITQLLQKEPEIGRMTFETKDLAAWNSALIVFLLRCRELCQERRIEFDRDSLPEGVLRLLDLAITGPTRSGGAESEPAAGFLVRTGKGALRLADTLQDNVGFIGDSILGFARLLRGRLVFRWQDVLGLARQCSVEALPIVTLIAVLVGMILAFVGSVQLERFGAAIYVADMVAIAMVREMGSMMTAITLCGRTGAAYAAQLGTMKVNQELDAFTVFGIPQVDFLVVPRVLALLVMLPLLTAFADVAGIAGGFAVAMGLLDLSALEYWQETLYALTLTQFSTGLVKSVAFALVIGLTGCLRGLQCGANAAAVGQATTSAVVTGITWIIIVDAIFAVLFNALGI